MSIAYCSTCDRIVEGSTWYGVEITVNAYEGTKTERRYESCAECGTEVTNLPEDGPEEWDQ